MHTIGTLNLNENYILRSTGQIYWPSEHPQLYIRRRMIELLPKVLWLQSWCTWILIFGCSFPTNLLFLCFIWTNGARTVNGLLAAWVIFSNSYLSYRMENGWTAALSTRILLCRCISPLNLIFQCCEKGCSNGQQISFRWKNGARTN